MRLPRLRLILIPLGVLATACPGSGPILRDAGRNEGLAFADAVAGEHLLVDRARGELAPVDAGPPPRLGNALLLDGGGVTALYELPANVGPRAIAFLEGGQELRAIDEKGAAIWKLATGAGQLFGGFDFDADGWLDLGLARSTPLGQTCGTTAMLSTRLDFVEGRTGKLHAPVAPLADLCWTFPTATYPTSQWTVLGVLFGAGTPELSLAPYYATTGWTFGFQPGAGFTTVGSYYYPSSSSYDSTYLNDKPNAFGGPESFTASPHVANGLILPVAGEQRLVFFTSARVVQYALGPISAAQLRLDTPFLPGGRKDLVGRNYGLVLPDPAAPGTLWLLAGTSADTLFEDMRKAKMEADPWGQIERHLARYQLASGAVEDRFFSYAHDASDGFKYEKRLVYPDGPLVRRSGPSRVAFNLYEGGHWQLHVTQPGSTADAKLFKDWFLWDIRDLDGDGLDEWVLSPARDPSDPDVPGYYFVKWRTVLARWDEGSLAFTQTREVQGAIPHLHPRFREPRKTSSRSFLYPALTARTGAGLALLLSDGKKLVPVVVGP